MNASKAGLFTMTMPSILRAPFAQVQHNVWFVEEGVFWLGRKLYHLAFQNRIAEAISKLFNNTFSQVKEAPQPQASKPVLSRRFPPLSLWDTTIWIDGKAVSEHGQCNVFSDDEIIEVCALTEEKKVQEVSVATVRSNGKTVIQQQATRGCTAAAATMLIVDHGKRLNNRYLVSTNLGAEASMCRAIEKAGLYPLVSHISPHLSSLRQAILRNGSAIVSIAQEKAGGHVIVVDEISEALDRVTLREPYHGWAIVVSGDTFLKQKFASTIIQLP